MVNLCYVSRDHYVRSGRLESRSEAWLAHDRPEIVWELGALGDSVHTVVFWMVNNVTFFPGDRGTRQVAAPWDGVGQARSVATRVGYQRADSEEGVIFRGEITVERDLASNWEASPFRTVGLDWHPQEVQAERVDLSRFPEGFVYGRFRLSHFTNAGGLAFALKSEFERFEPPTKTKSANPARSTSSPFGYYTAEILKVVLVDDPVAALPCSADRVNVQDNRLYSHRYNVSAGYYQTNEVSSFEIAEPAKADFAERVSKGRRAVRERWWRRGVEIAVIGLAVVGGVPVYLLSRAARRGVKPSPL